jgi:hypothetical protein
MMNPLTGINEVNPSLSAEHKTLQVLLVFLLRNNQALLEVVDH